MLPDEIGSILGDADTMGVLIGAFGWLAIDCGSSRDSIFSVTVFCAALTVGDCVVFVLVAASFISEAGVAG